VQRGGSAYVLTNRVKAMTTHNSPKVLLVELKERTSAEGLRYLSG
jgi:hypothetical protein